ncbi:profilin [Streptomyces sp. NPDC055085]
MSVWQSYVDKDMLGSGLTQGAILGTGPDTWSIWATSPGFTVSDAERKALLHGFQDPASIFDSGISVNGQTHLTIKADARSLHGRKGPDGVVAARANEAVVVGTYRTPSPPEQPQAP